MKPKQIKKFDELFLISYILSYIGATPNFSSYRFRYGSDVLYFEYYIIFNHQNCLIKIYQNNDGTIDIVFPSEFIARTAYDCYFHVHCDNNEWSALNWEKDNRLINGNSFKPLIDMNTICDSTTKKNLFIQQFSSRITRNSRLMGYAQKLNKITHIPFDTIILVILGIYSAMTSRCFNVAYKDGKTVPTGIYIFAELSSGTSKSRLVDFLISPMKQIIERKVKQKQSVIDALQDELADLVEFEPKNTQIRQLRASIRKHEKELSEIENLMPVTNATPEALEKIASKTNGIISIISSEQGAVDSSLGLSYAKKASNFDMLLNGSDGGYVKSSRSGREGFSGHVYATFVCFAQEGTAKKVLDASGVTGIFERSLLVAGKSIVGYRDYSNAIDPDAEMILEYEKQCSFFEESVEKRFDGERLITLHISDDDWGDILYFQNEMEGLLADGQIYSHPVMQRFVSKARMHIMKLAANLYLFNVEPENIPTDRYTKHYISHEYVQSAINMMELLINFVYMYCVNHGVINPNEQIKTVYDLFASNAVLTMHQIKKKCEKDNVFKNLPSPRQAIEDIVFYLADNYVLLKMGNDSYVKNTESYSSGFVMQ